MNAERLTTKSREVITGAVAMAKERGHATVEPWHLLMALLDTPGSTAVGLLHAVGADPNELLWRMLEILGAQLEEMGMDSVSAPVASMSRAEEEAARKQARQAAAAAAEKHRDADQGRYLPKPGNVTHFQSLALKCQYCPQR